MSSDPGLIVALDRPADGVAVITLNRPARKNALSIALRDQVSDALESLAADAGVRVVVITGSGDRSAPLSPTTC